PARRAFSRTGRGTRATRSRSRRPTPRVPRRGALGAGSRPARSRVRSGGSWMTGTSGATLVEYLMGDKVRIGDMILVMVRWRSGIEEDVQRVVEQAGRPSESPEYESGFKYGQEASREEWAAYGRKTVRETLEQLSSHARTGGGDFVRG